VPATTSRELVYRLTSISAVAPARTSGERNAATTGQLPLLLCQAGAHLVVQTTVAHLDDDGMVWRILDVHGPASEVAAARLVFDGYGAKHVVEREVMAAGQRRLVLWYKYKPVVEGGTSHTALAFKLLGRDTVVTDRTRGAVLTIRLLTRNGPAVKGFLKQVKKSPGFSLLYLGPPRDDLDAQLTPPEEDALRTAWQDGYFQVPGSVGVREVAKRMGISASAASYRLRRAVGKLVGRHLEP
jgi:hypothetical protein